MSKAFWDGFWSALALRPLWDRTWWRQWRCAAVGQAGVAHVKAEQWRCKRCGASVWF